MARRKDSPQKAAMREMMRDYRKYVIIRICPQLYFSDTLFS